MSNVPKELIEEATRRGIVPGAVCKSIKNGEEFIVHPIANWRTSDDNLRNGGDGNFDRFLLCSGQWATVIDPAAEGLKEGDAVECGPAMRAAIIELAEALGFKNLTTGCGDVVLFHANHTYEVSRTNDCVKNIITVPEVFIAKMRVTASQPKPIIIDGYEVKFEKGCIKVGCQTITNDTVRAIAAKLQD